MWQIAHKVKLPPGVMEGSGMRWCFGALLRNCTGSTRSLSEAKARGLQLPLEDTTTVTPCEQAYCPGVDTGLPGVPCHSLGVACFVPYPFLVMVHVVLLILGLFPFENLTLILRGGDSARIKFFLQSGGSRSVLGEGCSSIQGFQL